MNNLHNLFNSCLQKKIIGGPSNFCSGLHQLLSARGAAWTKPVTCQTFYENLVLRQFAKSVKWRRIRNTPFICDIEAELRRKLLQRLHNHTCRDLHESLSLKCGRVALITRYSHVWQLGQCICYLKKLNRYIIFKKESAINTTRKLQL